jgi:ABC-type dipeptide/oligopeptide/nickel transport system permease subunit
MWISIPPLLIMILVGAIIGRGVFGIVIAVAAGMFPGYIRLVYGQAMTVKQNDFIKASLAMGDSKLRIIFRHILPNCMSPMIVTMTMSLGGAVMAEAGLSFLGLGLAPPSPAWGTMANDGYIHLASLPLLSIAPGIALVVLVFGFNMVGDGIRDALDPKMRGTMD